MQRSAAGCSDATRAETLEYEVATSKLRRPEKRVFVRVFAGGLLGPDRVLQRFHKGSTRGFLGYENGFSVLSCASLELGSLGFWVFEILSPF